MPQNGTAGISKAQPLVILRFMRSCGDLCVVLALGMAARAWILFTTPLVPGINGAYYLIQARALLEKGSLAVPDFPLTFFWHAFLARTLQFLAGAPLETAILWATKLTDAIVPPLAAIPVYLLIRNWTGDQDGRQRWIASGAAAVIAFGAPVLSMIGDFQKNSLALVFLAGFIYAWRHSDAAALGLLALIGLTHVGVFGGALVLGSAIVLARLLIRGAVPWRQTALFGAAAIVFVLATVAVAWRFDPARVQRLVRTVSDPAQFLSSENLAFPMHGPPLALRFVPFALFGGLAFLAIRKAWQRRRQTPEDSACVMGCAATAMALTGPWFSFDTAMRLTLIAVIPAVIAFAYVLIHVRRRWVWAVAGSVALLLLAGPAIPLILRGIRPSIDAGAFAELQSARDALQFQPPESHRTLVVARHGVEWWSAWVLHTHIAQPQALRVEDWQRFERVLFLETKDQPPGPRGPRGAGPTPPPLMGPRIPPDAEIVYEGKFLRLARVYVHRLSTEPSSPRGGAGEHQNQN